MLRSGPMSLTKLSSSKFLTVGQITKNCWNANSDLHIIIVLKLRVDRARFHGAAATNFDGKRGIRRKKERKKEKKRKKERAEHSISSNKRHTDWSDYNGTCG